ncbi:MAG: malate dehydrogenase [Thermoproteota archaeon]|jgi:malate dehydrogenase|nr:malate dehydrogenase [Thermoproteota archaeon]
MTITIIGSGKVGASAALNCGLRELDDIMLLDIVEGLPQGEAMDISHQLSERGIDCNIDGSNNYRDMKGSEIVVLVAGIGRKPGMTRMDLLKTNSGIVGDVAGQIREYSPDCKLVVVTNPLDPMTFVALKKTKFDKSKVMGMGGMLDLSRYKSFISEAANVSRASVSAMVIGEHGENMLPLCRFSSIAGIPLKDFLSPQESQEILDKTKSIAAQVITNKGATTHAPGNAIATIVESILRDKKAVIPVSAYLEGEFGVNDVCIGVPAVIGFDGLERIIELNLNKEERQIFETGIANVQQAVRSIGIA